MDEEQESSKTIKSNNHQRSHSENTRPKTLGQFILGDKLGQGAFGFVRIARDTITGEKVAIKELQRSKIVQKADKVRIDREIKILQMFRHNNIAQLFSVVQSSAQIYFIMEYVSGKELSEYMKSKQSLNELEACRIFQQIISGIEYLNKKKIAHRDIKPANILLNNNNNVKLIDFGLSNIYSKGEMLSTACGSPYFAAPEMLKGKKYKPGPVDIWASGVVLFFMLTGHLPFEGDNNELLYKKITEGKFIIPHFLSDQAKSIIRRLLSTNPSLRINIKQIKEHPWFNKVQQESNIHQGLFTEVNVIPIDEDIVSSMEQYNYSKEDIRESLLRNSHNDITTVYYLLLNKKMGKGIPSVSDMKSKEYYDYITNKDNLMSRYDNDIEIVVKERRSSNSDLRCTKSEKEMTIAENLRNVVNCNSIKQSVQLSAYKPIASSSSPPPKKAMRWRNKSNAMISKLTISPIKEFHSKVNQSKKMPVIKKQHLKRKNNSICFSHRNKLQQENDLSLIENRGLKPSLALTTRKNNNVNAYISNNNLQLLTEIGYRCQSIQLSNENCDKVKKIRPMFLKDLVSFNPNVNYTSLKLNIKTQSKAKVKKKVNNSIQAKTKTLLSMESFHSINHFNYMNKTERKHQRVYSAMRKKPFQDSTYHKDNNSKGKLIQVLNNSNENENDNNKHKSKSIDKESNGEVVITIANPPKRRLQKKDLIKNDIQSCPNPLSHIIQTEIDIKNFGSLNNKTSMTSRIIKDKNYSRPLAHTLHSFTNQTKQITQITNSNYTSSFTSPFDLSCLFIKSKSALKNNIIKVLSSNKVKHKESTVSHYALIVIFV